MKNIAFDYTNIFAVTYADKTVDMFTVTCDFSDKEVTWNGSYEEYAVDLIKAVQKNYDWIDRQWKEITVIMPMVDYKEKEFTLEKVLCIPNGEDIIAELTTELI